MGFESLCYSAQSFHLHSPQREVSLENTKAVPLLRVQSERGQASKVLLSILVPSDSDTLGLCLQGGVLAGSGSVVPAPLSFSTCEELFFLFLF